MFEMQTMKIKKIIKENYRINSIVLDGKLNAKPGQFLMVWIPDLDEKPFGIANSNPLTLSVANVGPFSSKIHSLKEGDFLSFRGPIGTSFNLKNEKKIILVAGGYGVVPLYFLAKSASENKIKCTVILGAKTKEDLVYANYFENLKCKVVLCTDDGSCGEKGFVTNYLDILLKSEKFDKLFSCGPNQMMKQVGKICNTYNLPFEFSLEAYMKCGMGICGTCVIGNKLVCKDGPVFNEKELEDLGFFK